MKTKLFLFSLTLIISITVIEHSTKIDSFRILEQNSNTIVITNQKFEPFSINKQVDFNFTGTFPIPNPIQIRSIIILLLGSIPIGIVFIILLHRSRKRRRKK